MDNFLPLCASPKDEVDSFHLVLFPFAGGSTSSFQSWRRLQRVRMQVSLFVYPGRDHRMQDTLVASIAGLADQAVAQIEAMKVDPRRLIVAGHSMGAQVAYEVCARLERKSMRQVA